ncbi:hypothetical protein [uncultured Methanosphaera sp.]|nr:hypothetical protein [uncultured Methanosphaera sp.]
MRQKNKILIIILIIIAFILGVYSYTSYDTYQNLTMDGLTCEVPESSVNVTNQTDYQIYENNKENLKIIVYNKYPDNENMTNQTTSFDDVKNTAQKDAKPTTKNNQTFNKTPGGLCSYYADYSGRNVLITTPDENTMIHILQTLKVEPLEQVDLENNATDNQTTVNKDTNNKDASSNTQTSSKKSSSKSSSKSSGGGDDGYHYSPQYGQYVKSYTTSDGVQHIRGRDGYHEYYNPATGHIHSKFPNGVEYDDYFT